MRLRIVNYTIIASLSAATDITILLNEFHVFFKTGLKTSTSEKKFIQSHEYGKTSEFDTHQIRAQV